SFLSCRFTFFRCRLVLHSFPTRRSSDLSKFINLLVLLVRITQYPTYFQPIFDLGIKYKSCRIPLLPRTISYTLFISVVNKTTIRSEEHTSELQSREKLVCRLLLENKKSD